MFLTTALAVVLAFAFALKLQDMSAFMCVFALYRIYIFVTVNMWL